MDNTKNGIWRTNQIPFYVIFVIAGTNKKRNSKVNKIGAPADSLNSLVVNAVDFSGNSASYTRRGPVLSFFYNILNNTFKEIEDITDVHQMTNQQLKRLIQKIEVDKEGNVDIYLRLLGDLGLDESVLIEENETVLNCDDQT